MTVIGPGGGSGCIGTGCDVQIGTAVVITRPAVHHVPHSTGHIVSKPVHELPYTGDHVGDTAGLGLLCVLVGAVMVRWVRA